MIFEEVPLEKINFEDERFRVSEDLDPACLEDSLRHVGLLCPVYLLEGAGDSLIIVTGLRRLRALRRLGRNLALCRKLVGCNELDAFLIAVWENLSHRALSALESARVLDTLYTRFGISRSELVKVYLPILRLTPHKNVLRSFLALHRLPPNLRRAFNEGSITLASAERLAEAPVSFKRRIARVLGQVRWSASLQREVLDLIEELSAITESRLDEVLAQPAITAILDASDLSPVKKGQQVRDALFRLRNPRLSAARERFLDGKNKLKLPGSIRVSSDQFFETPRVRVEFDVSSTEGFINATSALKRAAQEASLRELFKVK